MTTPIHTKVVKIGNSQGIRIPRSLLEQAQLSGDVVLTVENSKLILQSAHKPRQGWSAAFQTMAAREDEPPLEKPVPTQWDEGEWEWE